MADPDHDHVERFLPELQGEIWYEHWHRYHWARPLAVGRRVLDAACGEGYGSALLSEVAAQVTGLDISAATIAAARTRYRRANLRYVHGDCTALPAADGSVELMVSFETIEHFSAQQRFVDEVARVLAPGGLFLVSSPNKPDYNEHAVPNPHHAHEMDEAEFRTLLSTRFPAQRWFAQGVDFHSTIAPFGRPPREGELFSTTNRGAAAPAHRITSAKYFLCACAATEAALAPVGERLSVLNDEEHFILGEHHRMVAAMERWRLEREELLAKVAQMEARLAHAERAVGRLAVERNRALLAVPPKTGAA